jgi:sugar O-acyltransferase (sialic acid O-acetyltransferase NeuD family)
MKPVLIFGAGQIAHVFRELIGYGHTAVHVVDKDFATSECWTIDGVKAMKSRDDWCFTIGMSFKGLNKARAEKFALMRGLGIAPLTWRSGDVWLPNSAKIGSGSFILDRNTIQTGVEIGENCVLWSGNHVGHHTKIGNHVWLSSGIVVSGACEIGDFSFIGSGATIIDGVKIGKRCIIGAGATITSDCEDDGVYPGPAAVRSKVPSNKLKGVWAQ